MAEMATDPRSTYSRHNAYVVSWSIVLQQAIVLSIHRPEVRHRYSYVTASVVYVGT